MTFIRFNPTPDLGICNGLTKRSEQLCSKHCGDLLLFVSDVSGLVLGRSRNPD